MSGGVDSSTAAALLLERACDVSGIFMVTCEQSYHSQIAAVSAAKKLGIQLHILDMRQEFKKLIQYFCSEYKQGRTPNPCVYCNRRIKFGKLLSFARNNGAELFATGHYARIINTNGDYGLYAADTAKDQSYALAMVKREILPYLILPMADLSKDQTRKIAEQTGLQNAQRKESQEICFIPDDDYVSMLEQMSPELIKQGDIIDNEGNVLGRHKGIHRYTIGQRRGLGIAMQKPYYVAKLNAKTNTVTLAAAAELEHRKLSAGNVNWLRARPNNPFRANVKIRYNDNGSPATVYPKGENVEVVFDEPVRAVTPGQLTVFYTEQENLQRLAGGAWIERAWD